jgi:hypothetical protein
MGPTEVSCLRRLCNMRRIKVGCLGRRMIEPGRRGKNVAKLSGESAKSQSAKKRRPPEVRGTAPGPRPAGSAGPGQVREKSRSSDLHR